MIRGGSTPQRSWRSAALLVLALRDWREVHRSGAGLRTGKCSSPQSAHLLASLPESYSDVQRRVRARRKSPLQILHSPFRALLQSIRGASLETAEARERHGSSSETFEWKWWREIVPARWNRQRVSGRQPWRTAGQELARGEMTSDRSEGPAAAVPVENGRRTQMAARVLPLDGH